MLSLLLLNIVLNKQIKRKKHIFNFPPNEVGFFFTKNALTMIIN